MPKKTIKDILGELQSDSICGKSTLDLLTTQATTDLLTLISECGLKKPFTKELTDDLIHQCLHNGYGKVFEKIRNNTLDEINSAIKQRSGIDIRTSAKKSKGVRG